MVSQILENYYAVGQCAWCIVQMDVADVDLNFVIETDLHLLSVIVVQLGATPPQYVTATITTAAATIATTHSYCYSSWMISKGVFWRFKCLLLFCSCSYAKLSPVLQKTPL